MECIQNSKTPLNSHQKKVVEFIMKNRGLLVVHSTGSGKTLSAVTAAKCVLDMNKKIQVFVIAPKSLLENFKKEMKDTYVLPKEDYKRFNIMTKEHFVRNVKVSDCQDKFLIIDEAHNIKTEIKGKSGKTAKKIIECAKKAWKVLLLSATPVVNDPYDIVNLMSMLYGTDPISKSEFNKFLYSKDGNIVNEELFKRYFDCKISFFSPSVSNEYPSADVKNVQLYMDRDYYNDYSDIEESILGVWQDEVHTKGKGTAFYSGLRQAVNKISTPELSKIQWIMNKLTSGQKTLIFSEFIGSTLIPLKKIMKQKGIKFVSVTGDMSVDNRKKAVRLFNTNKAQVIVISKAGGEGLDLKGTRNVIIMEPAWNKAREEQIIGRAIRYKSHSHLPQSERHVIVYKLYVTKPTPEMKKEFLKRAERSLLPFTPSKVTFNKARKGWQKQVDNEMVAYPGRKPPVIRRTINRLKRKLEEIKTFKDYVNYRNYTDTSYVIAKNICVFTKDWDLWKIDNYCNSPQNEYFHENIEMYRELLQEYDRKLEAKIGEIIDEIKRSLYEKYTDKMLNKVDQYRSLLFELYDYFHKLQKYTSTTKYNTSDKEEYEKQKQYNKERPALLLKLRSSTLGQKYGDDIETNILGFSKMGQSIRWYLYSKYMLENLNDQEIVDLMIDICIITKQHKITKYAEKTFGTMKIEGYPKHVPVFSKAMNIIDSLERTYNYYTAPYWITGKGERRKRPESIDNYVKNIADRKEKINNEFLAKIKGFSIENNPCHNVDWEKISIVQAGKIFMEEAKKQKEQEHEQEQEDHFKSFTWTECLDPKKFTPADLKAYAAIHNVHGGLQPLIKPRGKIRNYMCSVLRWKMEKSLSFSLIALPVKDLLILARSLGMNTKPTEKLIQKEFSKILKIMDKKKVEISHKTGKIKRINNGKEIRLGRWKKNNSKINLDGTVKIAKTKEELAEYEAGLLVLQTTDFGNLISRTLFEKLPHTKRPSTLAKIKWKVTPWFTKSILSSK